MSDSTGAFDLAGMSWLRRYTWMSLSLLGLFLLALPAYDLVREDFGTANTVFLALVLAAAAVQRVRFLAYTANAVAYERRRPIEQILTSAVAVIVWAHAARYTNSPEIWALLPAAVGGAGVVSAQRPIRAKLVFGLLLATAVTGGLALSWRHLPGVSVGPVVLAAAVLVVVFVLFDMMAVRFWELVLELDRARELAGELAAARERLRFSADLHDIQGHSLQAIILKGQLAERLVGKDDEAARKHAAELTELARSALAETREVAHGYRRVGLRTELTNALDLLAAAGIEVESRGEAAAVVPPLQQPFGALLREATTNVLRHSRARRCVLTIEADGGAATIRLGNDGVAHLGPADESADGSGVRGLRERFATIGGEVTAGRTGEDWFEISGWAEEPGRGRR